MKSLRRSLAAFAAFCAMSAAVFAADPSGTWTWVQAGFGGRGRGGEAPATPPPAPPPQQLVLALKDGKLTGTLTSPPGRGGGDPVKTEITNATFKDDVVAFEVTRTNGQGNQTTQKFEGKLAGDTITGKRIQPGRQGGEPMPVDWVATKSK